MVASRLLSTVFLLMSTISISGGLTAPTGNVSSPMSPTATIINGIGSPAMHVRDANPAATGCSQGSYGSSAKIGSPNICGCYNEFKGNTYSRALMIDAIVGACNVFDKPLWGADANDQGNFAYCVLPDHWSLLNGDDG